jgi:hypothetical protein
MSEVGIEGVHSLIELENSAGWALRWVWREGGCQLREKRKEEHGL